MYASDITLGTNTFSLTTSRPLSSVRSMASQPVSEPITLTLSHENAKNGRRSSVAIFDDTTVVSVPGATVPVKDTIKVLFKVQYNPFGGRTTNEADIQSAIDNLIAFLSVPANIDKFLNQES